MGKFRISPEGSRSCAYLPSFAISCTLIPALLAGDGNIIASSFTITPDDSPDGLRVEQNDDMWKAVARALDLDA